MHHDESSFVLEPPDAIDATNRWSLIDERDIPRLVDEGPRLPMRDVDDGVGVRAEIEVSLKPFGVNLSGDEFSSLAKKME
jgi:hypothetical protein